MYMPQRSQTVPSVPNCFNSEKTTLIEAPIIPGRLLQTIRDALPAIEDAISLHVPVDASPLFSQLLSTWASSTTMHTQKHLPSENGSRLVRWLSFLKINKSVAPMKMSTATKHTYQSMHNLEIISGHGSQATFSISSSQTTPSLSKSHESVRSADAATPRAVVRNISGMWSKLGRKMRTVMPSRSNKRPRTLIEKALESRRIASERDHEEEEKVSVSTSEDYDTASDQEIFSDDPHHTPPASMSESDAFFFNRYVPDHKSTPSSTYSRRIFNGIQRATTPDHPPDTFDWQEPNRRQSGQQPEDYRLSWDRPPSSAHPQQIQKSKTDTNVQSEDPVPYVRRGLGGTTTIYPEPSEETGHQSQSQHLSTSSTSLLQWQQQFHIQQQHHDKISATLRCVAWALYDIIYKNHLFGRFESDPTYVANPHHHMGDPVSTQELHMTKPKTHWRDIYEQICYVFDCGELTSEHGVITLMYIQRMLENSAQHLCDMNWRLIVLAGLLTTVKVWDDCAVYNSDFSQIFPELDTQTINRVEQQFLRHIDWDVSVRCSLFANTYFELRDISTNMNFR